MFGIFWCIIGLEMVMFNQTQEGSSLRVAKFDHGRTNTRDESTLRSLALQEFSSTSVNFNKTLCVSGLERSWGVCGGGVWGVRHTYPLIIIITITIIHRVSMLLNRACRCPTHQPQRLQQIALPRLSAPNKKATHGEGEERKEDMDTHTHT